jgi:tRNA threonylcarbamoyladenosine biosynthesis protein TsaB
VTVLSPALRVRRPGALAELAWARFQAGQADDPIALEPIYLHGKD